MKGERASSFTLAGGAGRLSSACGSSSANVQNVHTCRVGAGVLGDWRFALSWLPGGPIGSNVGLPVGAAWGYGTSITALQKDEDRPDASSHSCPLLDLIKLR